MASLNSHFFLLLLCLLVSIRIRPVRSQTCTSQKLANNKLYANCTDLPTLSSYLHYTYNSTNSSLSIAFIAPPAKPDGWIAWGINPNRTGMVGTQALVAMKTTNGSLVAKTYNLKGYHEIIESKLSFDVWDLSAETQEGDFVIYANVKVGDVDKVNQVWQVGSSVTDGHPDQHAFSRENLGAKGELAFVSSSTTNSTASEKGEGYKVKESNLGVILGCFVILIISSFVGY